MQVTISSKGQLVLPAPMRRRLRLKARSKVELEERDGGVFLRPAGSGSAIAPIDYPVPGSMKVNRRMLALDALAGPDWSPAMHERWDSAVGYCPRAHSPRRPG